MNIPLDDVSKDKKFYQRNKIYSKTFYHNVPRTLVHDHKKLRPPQAESNLGHGWPDKLQRPGELLSKVMWLVIGEII